MKIGGVLYKLFYVDVFVGDSYEMYKDLLYMCRINVLFIKYFIYRCF